MENSHNTNNENLFEKNAKTPLRIYLETTNGNMLLFEQIQKVFNQDNAIFAFYLSQLIQYLLEHPQDLEIFDFIRSSSIMPKITRTFLFDLEWMLENQLFDQAVNFYRQKKSTSKIPGRKSRINQIIDEFDLDYKFYKEYGGSFDPIENLENYIKKHRFATSTVYKAMKRIKKQYTDFESLNNNHLKKIAENRRTEKENIIRNNEIEENLEFLRKINKMQKKEN